MWEPKLESSSSSPSSSGTTNSSSAPQSQQSNNKLNVEDSGHIDSGFLSSEHILQSYSEEDSAADKKAPPSGPIVGKGLGQQQSNNNSSQQNGNEGKEQQQFDSYLDSGLVEDAEFVSGSALSGDEGMLLERELDNGLAEWQCSLDLKNNSLGGGQTNNQPHNPLQINNLSRKVDMATASLDQMNISDAPARQQGRGQEQELEMPEEEQPWEMCYKQDAEGDTYLHLAVSEGADDIVRDLIKITPHPCLLDIQNDQLQSSLHLAVIASNVRLVRMLLLAGAESSIRDKYGNTPLHLACAAGDLECVRALTERITATEEATAISCSGLLVTPVPSMADQQQKQQQQEQATKQQQKKQIKRLHLVQYADVELRNYDGERCVHIAASVTGTEKNKHVDVMRELVVRSGADVNAREGKAGYTALHMAVERGDRDLVKFLLDECSSSVNLEVASYGRWTAYQIATVNRNQELMSLLRSKGAEALDVSSSDESDDSDFDDNEILEIYGAASASSSATTAGISSFYNDRTVPCVGY